MRLLVTGFEPFGGDGYNPSGALVKRLTSEADTVTLVLPVTWSGALRVLLARADREGAEGCVMFGLSGAAEGLLVEGVAYNLADAGIADNAGVLREGARLDDRGPERVECAVPLAPLVAKLRASAVPVERSDDPGRFICNALYYGVLTAGRPYSSRSVFIHVPATKELGGRLEAREVERWIVRAVEAFREVSAR